MKLFFIYHDRAGYYGGPVVNARRLLPELCRRGHEVHCLMLQKGVETTHVQELERDGVHCRLQPLDAYLDDQVRAILEHVRETAADVFIPNLSVAGFLAGRWVREAGIPTIAACRNDDAFHRAVVEQFVAGDPQWAVSGLACVSQGLHDKVAALAPPRTRLCVIPSGVPVPGACATQSGALKLVYVGRLEQKQKRILDLVDAFAAAIRALPGTRAAIIGEGRERAAVEQRIAALGLGHAIRVRGAVPVDAIHAELARHDVIVLLSDYEGTPGAVMDGMAAGLVPVCLDIPGGVRELVVHENTGLLVADRDDAFVAALRRLAADGTLRRRLAANARAHVQSHFSLAVAADRWEHFCRELLGEAGPRRSVRTPVPVPLPALRLEFSGHYRHRRSFLRRAAGVLARMRRRIGES